MGKGDARTKRGKIFRHSFGNSRPQNPNRKVAGPAATPKAPARPAIAPRNRGKR
jgi:ribosomal small subunit protein bTHX